MQLSSAQNVIEEASDKSHTIEFLEKNVHDNSLERTGKSDTCKTNLEKTSSEQHKPLYAIPLCIFQYHLLEVPR